MGLTPYTGPLLTFGVTLTSSGGQQEYNEERAPSPFDLGSALADPRPFYSYKPGSAVGTPVFSFFDNIGLVDGIPSSAQTANIAATNGASAITVGVPLTLITSLSSLGISQVTITAPETGKAVTVAAIDGAASGITFGSGGTVNVWNPATLLARTIQITGSSGGQDDSAATFSVVGRDVYGFKMTETISGTSRSSLASYKGVKAFKYIASVTPLGTLNSTVLRVGTNDTFGFPFRIDSPSQFSVWVGPGSSGSWVTTPAVTYASTVATQTSTTPDVRGTYASTTATQGAVASSNITSTDFRIILEVAPQPAQLATITAASQAGLFGAAQFSSV